MISHGIYPFDGVGGVELYTSEMSHFLSEVHEITVMVFKSPSSLGEELYRHQEVEKINLIWVPGSRARDHVPHDSFNSNQFRAFLQETTPDLIYLMSPYKFPFKLIDEARSLKVPWVVHLHDFYLMCPRIHLLHRKGYLCNRPKKWRCVLCQNKLSRPKKAFLNFVRFNDRIENARTIINEAQAVLCVSQNTAKYYKKLGLRNEKIIIVPPVWKKEVVLQHRKNQANDVLRIGFFGGASTSKGIKVLSEALKRVNSPWKLSIYGLQKDKSRANVLRLFKGMEERIILQDYFAPNMLDEVCASLDVLAVPSIWPETYCRVVDEATMRGVIVIASDIGGMAERLVDGINAFVVPAGDTAMLAEKISFISGTIKTLRQSMRFGHISLREENYSEKVLEILDSIAQKQFLGGFLFEYEPEILRICKITGTCRDEVGQRLLKELQNPGSTVNSAWLAAGPPKNETEINDFYRSNDAYLYDLVVAHSMWERNQWRRIALSELKKLGCKSVMDYGGGIGTDSLFFAKAGLIVTYYEPNEILCKFAEDFACSEKIDLKICLKLQELPDSSFDAVYCTEVLEHVVNPKQLLKDIRYFLNAKGYLIVTESFGSIGKRFLTHLPENVIYKNQLDKIANQAGFSLHKSFTIPGNQMHIFKCS